MNLSKRTALVATYEQNESRRWIASARKIGELIEANPDTLTAPNSLFAAYASWNVSEVRDWDGERDENGEYPLIASAQEHLLAVRRCFRGVTWEKVATDYSYGYRGEWQGIRVTITAARSAVCERVEIGTETYEEDVPTAVETVTKTRPVYEWRCPE